MIPVYLPLRNLALVFTVSLLAPGASLHAATGETTLQHANELYDAGQYSAALPIYEQAAAATDLDGITLYRLYFCQKNADLPVSRQTLERARVALDKEAPQATGFEVAFYRSNAYTNLGLGDQVGAVAQQVTSRFEHGAIPEPTTAVEQFRLGKLFADQSRNDDAELWFSRAAAGFASAQEQRHRSYFLWSARWVAERALADERFEVVARHYGYVEAGGAASVQELDKLGFACLIIGDYDGSQRAYQHAARLQPADSTRYTYSAGLARLAAQAGTLPVSPDGERGWDETSKEELEEILKGQSQAVRAIKQEAEPTSELTGKQRSGFDARLAQLQPLFVAAAVEYTRRGFNLREAAFFGGFAPLVFQTKEWRLLAAPRKRWTRAMIEAERKRFAQDKEASEGEKND